MSVKFNLMNLNRQAKLYSQGMRPLCKILPHQQQWERIKEKPVSGVRRSCYHYLEYHLLSVSSLMSRQMEEQAFVMSFKFTMPCEENATVYFAFCFPYAYTELQEDLDELDSRFSANEGNIYYKRDLLCRSEHCQLIIS